VKKKILPKPQNLHATSDDQSHHSWQKEIDTYYEQLKTYSVTMSNDLMNASRGNNTGSGGSQKQKRIAFMFDSSLVRV